MADTFVSERNVRFMLYEVFDAESLTRYPRFSDHSREVFDMILNTSLKMAEDLFKPVFGEMDKNPPEFVDGVVKVHPSVRTILKESGDGGWISAIASPEHGGLQLPVTVAFMSNFITCAANYSASVYSGLTAGAANLIESFCTKEDQDKYLPNMYAGLWQGTMALTEPQAGTSLSDIVTSAEPMAEGYYKIRGQKLFISAGDHDGVENVVHMLLGRIKGAPAGVKGMSLFIVPKKRIDGNGEFVPNDVNCAGIYHKLGYRGCPITQLSFGENDDCRGYLVGEPNKGLSYMFHMMNEARINVGIGAAGIASAAYYAALEYAKERPQGRQLTSKDPTSPQIPIIEHADVRRMLLFQKAIVEGSLSLLMQCSKYYDLAMVTEGEEKEKYSFLLDILTPVAKTYPSEMGILSVSQGLQCLGGYGFCDEFPLEQYYRDVRIHTIHEGTTSIQGLDLLGRKVTMKNGKAMTYLLAEIQDTIQKAEQIQGLEIQATDLKKAVDTLQAVTMHLIGHAMNGKIDLFLADATLYLELFGIIVIAWQWLVQGLVVCPAMEKCKSPEEIDFYKGKIFTLLYFFKYELPKTEALAKSLMNTDGHTLSMRTEYFC